MRDWVGLLVFSITIEKELRLRFTTVYLKLIFMFYLYITYLYFTLPTRYLQKLFDIEVPNSNLEFDRKSSSSSNVFFTKQTRHRSGIVTYLAASVICLHQGHSGHIILAHNYGWSACRWLSWFKQKQILLFSAIRTT